MVAEIRLNGTDRVRAYALDLGEHAEFGLNEEDAPQQAWARYIFGVCREIQKRGKKITGFDTVFAGGRSPRSRYGPPPQHWRAPLPLPSTTSSL